MSRENRLFDRFDSFSAVQQLKQRLNDEVRDLQESRLKGTNIEDWITHFKSKYIVNIPLLNRDGIEGDIQDVQLNARHFHHRIHFGDGDNNFIPTPGTRVTFTVPYSGDTDFFGCSGNTYMASFPRAEVARDRLTFHYETIDHDENKINGGFERDLNSVEGHLRSLVGQFEDFNSWIEPTVRRLLNDRLEKFKKDEELASRLKYPLKKRTDAPTTSKVPEIKRAAVPKPLPSQKASTPADPTLEMDHYEHILTVVKNMVRVMECSPRAFKELDEEDLRFHFLVQLNGQYEGMATGETFNYQGKTDILIKYNGQNLFVGECKFWKGPKGYTETINQVLKYVTWRETKTAIFVFCKNVDPSVPIQKIADETADHPNYLKRVPFGDGSTFRFIFKHPGDASKEMFLTVMVFNIPS